MALAGAGEQNLDWLGPDSERLEKLEGIWSGVARGKLQMVFEQESNRVEGEGLCDENGPSREEDLECSLCGDAAQVT